MEPTLPTPQASPERGSETSFNIELPQVKGGEVARVNETKKEPSLEQKSGAGAGENTTSNPIPMPTIALPPPLQGPSSGSQSAITNDDGTPLVAADEDLIEKVWIEKAKKVISETKHDPYAQEQAVSRLQADYLNKRYGKTIRIPEEG